MRPTKLTDDIEQEWGEVIMDTLKYGVDNFVRDLRIIEREFEESSPPALKLRAMLTNLGIKIVPNDEPGVVLANVDTNTISIGGDDEIARRGPYNKEVRAYTSALMWGFSCLRLAPLGISPESQEVRTYAAVYLCGKEALLGAPELAEISQGRPLGPLAERLAVDEWVLREALLAYGLLDRILVEA